MKKLISLTIISALVLSTFVGCKKGENDPFSLLSRTARITGVWNLTSADYDNTYINKYENTTVTTVIDYTYDGTNLIENEENEGDTTAYSEKITINKDGTYELVITKEKNYWEGIDRITGSRVTTETGLWYFIPGNDELDVKNKERVEFLVESYTIDYADPDTENYTEEYAGRSNNSVSILTLDRLANKELIALLDYTEADDNSTFQETGTKTYTRE